MIDAVGCRLPFLLFVFYLRDFKLYGPFIKL